MRQSRRLLDPINISLLSLLLASSALASIPALSSAEYERRLKRAAEAASALADESEIDQARRRIAEIRELVPAQAEVSGDGTLVRADNAWLHALLDALDTRYRERRLGEPQTTRLRTDLAARLQALGARVAEQSRAGARSDQDEERARLSSILAREEYRPEVREESRLQRWISRVWDAFIRFLLRIFASRGATPPPPGTSTLNLIRLALALALSAALLLSIASLARRFKRRRRRAKGSTAKREVLGERLDQSATAEDLLAEARALARDGEYRRAIRRAHLALLCELERQGRLRLDRAKTNRDYLRELGRDAALFSRLTLAFERIWYGEARATEEDFHLFIDLYREALAQNDG